MSVDLFLKDVAKLKMNSPEAEAEIISRIESGDDSARDELITRNLRICISIAKQYQGKGIDFADLISSATLGIHKASRTFDPSKGIKFVSYAVWWIRDAILSEIIEHGKSIRVPSEKVTKLNRMNRKIAEFEQENGRTPSFEELAELMNTTEKGLKDLIMNCTFSIVPDALVNPEGEEESLFESLYVEEGNTDKRLRQEATSITVVDFLKKNLNDMEYEVVTKFFGIGHPETSLEVIGEQMSITKERVRQIKDKAIIKLRKSDGVEQLANFL